MLTGVGKKTGILMLISLLTLDVFGQNRSLSYTTISGHFGTSHYYGDLASPHTLIGSSLNSLRWHIGLSVSRPLSQHWSVALGLNWIRLGADDNNSKGLGSYVRNLHFRNDLKELSLRGVYGIIGKEKHLFRRADFNPYVSAGIAYFFHNPKAKLPDNLGGDWISLHELNTEGEGLNPLYGNQYALIGIALPIGFGISYKYNKRVDVGIELMYRTTFTDYLDDVSGRYPNPLLLKSQQAKALSNRSQEEIAARTGNSRTERLLQLFSQQGTPTNYPYTEALTLTAIGTRRGDDTQRDSYVTLSFTIIYHIPDGIKCPQ